MYAFDSAVDSIMPGAPAPAPAVTVRVAEAEAKGGALAFSLSLINRASDRWTGQDWLVQPVNAGGLPVSRGLGGSDPGRWFPGQIVPEHERTQLTYEFDPRTASLSVRAADGRLGDAGRGGAPLAPGHWMLVVRLIREVDRGTYVGHKEAAYIPVMQMEITNQGEVLSRVFEGDLDAGRS